MVFHFYLVLISIRRNEILAKFPYLYIILDYLQVLFIVKMLGTFRPTKNKSHLHDYFNLTEIMFETVGKSLRHSCRTAINCQ